MTVKTDVVAEYTGGSGVTIDGVLIKDGNVDGVDVSAVSTAVNDAAQAIPHAGTLMLPQTMEYANRGVFHAEAYGASPAASGAVNTAAINAAIVDAAVIGGEAQLRDGQFTVSGSIEMKQGVTLTGSGRRATWLVSECTGSVPVIKFNCVSYATVRDLTIALTTVEAQVGIEIFGQGGVGNSINNYIDNVEIVAGSGVILNQIGIYLNGTVSGSCVSFNAFSGMWITNVARPIIISSYCEANSFSQFNIDRFGAGATGIGVLIEGHANWFNDIWFGGGEATINYGFYLTGNAQYNTLSGLADIGAGSLFNLAWATGTRHSGGVNGVTTYGDVQSNHTLFPSGYIGIGTLTPVSELDISTGIMTIKERSAPGAPPANSVHIYAVDNGAGKTQLMALFATGAAQQIAIEP